MHRYRVWEMVGKSSIISYLVLLTTFLVVRFRGTVALRRTTVAFKIVTLVNALKSHHRRVEL